MTNRALTISIREIPRQESAKSSATISDRVQIERHSRRDALSFSTGTDIYESCDLESVVQANAVSDPHLLVNIPRNTIKVESVYKQNTVDFNILRFRDGPRIRAAGKRRLTVLGKISVNSWD